MIDEKKLIEVINNKIEMLGKGEVSRTDEDVTIGLKSALALIDEQEKIGEWIPCSERLPEERDSIFTKFKGTDKWKDGMFERISEDVLVTVEFNHGSRITEVSHTIDGEWKFDISILQRKIISWQPLPEPYKEE